MLENMWAKVVKCVEFVCIATTLIVFIRLSEPLLRGSLAGKDFLNYLSGLIALIISWVGFYLLTVRPFITRPQLGFSAEPAQKSEPTESEKQKGTKRSWFLRLRVTNRGIMAAKDCIGRLVEVQRGDGKTIGRFDPLHLYWARQDKPDNFRPVDIQGNGDSYFLDIAQVKEKEDTLSLRVLIPKDHRLVRDPDLPIEPDLPPGTYFICVAVYGEGGYIKPTWFTIRWKSDYSVDPPCSITRGRAPSAS